MLDCSRAVIEDVVLEIAEIFMEMNLSPVDQRFTQNEGRGRGVAEASTGSGLESPGDWLFARGNQNRLREAGSR